MNPNDPNHAPSTLGRAIAIARRQGMARLLLQSKNYFTSRFLGRLRIRRALPDFRERVSSVTTLDEAVDFAYSWKSWGIAIRPFQNRDEIAALFKVVEPIKPRTVVEIGTGWGGTLFLFATVAGPDAILVSLDLPSSLFGRGYPKWKDRLYKSFARDGQKLELVRGNSHQASSMDAVKQCLGSRQIDVLFIDGDHTYEGVKKDFELYSPLVRKGGLIVFHDITPNLKNSEIEVPLFWNELRDAYENSEIRFLQDESGIGILRV